MQPEDIKSRIDRLTNEQSWTTYSYFLEKGEQDFRRDIDLDHLINIPKISRDQWGTPTLPRGYHMSVSHTKDIWCAVVSHRARLGLDIEINRPIDYRIVQRIASNNEWAYLRQYTRQLSTRHHFWTWCFCVKEAVYKMLPGSPESRIADQNYQECLLKCAINNQRGYFLEPCHDDTYTLYGAFDRDCVYVVSAQKTI